jgi:hypothetical protein
MDVKEAASVADLIYIPYSVCLADHPACYISNNTNLPCDSDADGLDQMNESILKAQLMDNNGNITPLLLNDDKHFTVSH